MKGAISTTTIFQYILGFTLLFAAFLTLAITYNKVFKLKNEMISIFEKYEGVTTTSIDIVNNYLSNSGYETKGECEVGEYGIKDLNSSNYEKVSNTRDKYFYCINYKKVTGNNGDKIYYDLKLFFKFNLPFIGELFTFRITGETKGVNYYSREQLLT